MPDTIGLPKLSPEMGEEICGALRTWAPILHDFYRTMIDQGAPADLANGLVIAWFEQTICAGYAAEYE